MKSPIIEKEFEKLIKNKFNVYNSLFLSLPYSNISKIGMLVPLLQDTCRLGLEEGNDPLEILDSFFATHTSIVKEEEKLDFMFQVIQYVERQIVLYDSVEDAAFSQIQTLDNNLSLKDYINVLENRKDGDVILDKLSSFSTRFVLTAHPTQFYPPSVLDIIAKLKTLITNNDINEIDITLQQLALTSLVNPIKPTPIVEAKNIIYFLRHVYYDAVTSLYSNIKKNIKNRNFNNPNIIQFGFWPGGDRDGNPFVTSETTNEVADELRMNLMKCYYGDIKVLAKKLTFSGVEDKIAKLRARVYAAIFDTTERISFEEIMKPLCTIKDTLIDDYNSIYLEEVESLIGKVKIFRTHFAALDIRQHHSIHRQTIEAILKKENIITDKLEELSKDDLIRTLLHNDFQINAEDYAEDIIKDTIKTIAQLSDIQDKNGQEGCNRYIISNSEDIFSVLFVFSLLRWCCWENGEIPMDIIPLFESMEGMDNSEGIMKELFDLPEYRDHVNYRHNVQTIMLGFSDGTKDGGYLQANWSIFKTKENLSGICDAYDIKPIFFDGRGGPPSRGGGKTHQFYASQTKKIANHAIQLTIQGQTISSKYGTKEQFAYNCEQMLTAGLSNSLAGNENDISESSRQIIEELALISFEKYTALKNHEMFIPYLENKSTLKYYSKANIGSRPSKRGNDEDLDFKDLRAIPFVGSWSQLKQNVPGYFGVGTAIKSLVDDGKLEDLKRLFKEAPFFRALIHNSMMALYKCYFELTAYIAKDETYKDFWNILFEEYKLSKEMTLLISGYSILMEKEPISRNSVKIREQIVLPLLITQQYALQKIEQNTAEKEKYQKIVERSLYGNINASRNSA